MESLDQINTRARFIATGLILKLDVPLRFFTSKDLDMVAEEIQVALNEKYAHLEPDPRDDNVLTLERVRIALESAYLSGYAACNAARLADLQLRQVEVEART